MERATSGQGAVIGFDLRILLVGVSVMWLRQKSGSPRSVPVWRHVKLS